MVESVVLDHAVSDVVLLARSTGNRCGSGVCLQAAGVGEAAAVVAGFGENLCRELDSEAWEARDYLGIRVLAKADVNCFGEIFTGLAGCFELLQQSEELLGEGVFDSCGLVSLLGPKDAAQAVSLLVNAAYTAGAPECETRLAQRWLPRLRRKRWMTS